MDIILEHPEFAGTKPIIILTIRNTFSYPAMIVLAKITPDSFDGDYFEFSRDVPYIGPRGNGVYSNDELLLLQPGQAVNSIINLSRIYELGDYSRLVMNYVASHPVDGQQADWVTLESNNIRFD